MGHSLMITPIRYFSHHTTQIQNSFTPQSQVTFSVLMPPYLPFLPFLKKRTAVHGPVVSP